MLALIAEGDEAAFTSLFHQYSTPLSSLALRLLKSDQARQEVLQEYFIKLWLNRQKMAEVIHLSAWLKKVMINDCLQYLRRQSVYEQKLASLPGQRFVVNEGIHSMTVREIQQAVKQAVESLSPQRRTIFQLSREKGLTTRQIAESLNLSEGYVRNALSAALQIIRNSLPHSIELPSILFLLFF